MYRYTLFIYEVFSANLGWFPKFLGTINSINSKPYKAIRLTTIPGGVCLGFDKSHQKFSTPDDQ